MRARNIKPGLFKNEILGSADLINTVLFAGLWCMADREGRLEDRPLRISAELFPYRPRVNERRVDKILSWLDEKGFIKRYTASGVDLIQIVNFSSHQNPHRKELPSKYQSLSSVQPGSGPVLAQGQNGAGTGPARLIPDSGSLIPDCGLPGPVPATGPGDAWRDVGCDPEAMLAWINHRRIVKPPGLRGHEQIEAAKMLNGMGGPTAQRTAVRTAIANGWSNLRPTDGQSRRGPNGKPELTRSEREAADAGRLEQLKASRPERGIPKFRNPLPHESADAYETQLKHAEREIRTPLKAIANLVESKRVAK